MGMREAVSVPGLDPNDSQISQDRLMSLGASVLDNSHIITATTHTALHHTSIPHGPVLFLLEIPRRAAAVWNP